MWIWTGIVCYLAIGFVSCVIATRVSEYPISEDDAVFCTVAWPLLLVGFLAKLYTTLVNKLGNKTAND